LYGKIFVVDTYTTSTLH